jgi:predicted NUDIX family NTP pyrophosphohydrolase
MYKIKDEKMKVFIVHPGGPFWKGKDIGAWSIPKGEAEEGENLLSCAIREVKEETGIDASGKELIDLGFIVQKSGKKVYCWAFEGDWIGLLMCKSYAQIEWPYKSGKIMRIPEVDKAEFFDAEKAKERINKPQGEFIDRLKDKLKIS